MSVIELVRKGTIEIESDSGEFLGTLDYDHEANFRVLYNCDLRIPIDSEVTNNVPRRDRPKNVHYFKNGNYAGSELYEQHADTEERPSQRNRLFELFRKSTVIIPEFKIPDAIRKVLKAVDSPHLRDTLQGVVGKYL